MAADQAFMDRIHRIEQGKQWVPDGICVSEGKTKGRKRRPLTREKLFTVAASTLILFVLYKVTLNSQPQIAEWFLQGGPETALASLTGAIGG
ncbi:hypothetical protein CLV78_101667 [Aliiruegeria haliotis]|uniref:Uncharacterized protein n=1 Tax=Aliiruegeria haliotis TaxID=1280846 RepID=A0A2T0RZF7_9RHOB|nr:hypothetical protein [Aliiruegeria haliotis]PRY26568.1 hypothetical protein CLV78_101667 [Aliiruegeria haliotis]